MDRVEYIKKRISGKVLDVGYYACTLHEEVLKTGGRENVFGIDTECPQETNYYKKASAENIPFNANEFDTLIAGELVEHLATPELFIKEANRVLKQGGRMVITTPNRGSLMHKIFHNNNAPLHLSLLNIKDLTELLEKNGFEIEDFSCMPYTIESSEGSSKPWSFPFRKAINYFLPKALREEMVVTAKKK